MADILKDSVHDTTTTTGTGALTILGAAPTGRRTIAAGLTTGQTGTFRIEDASGNWEVSSGMTWTTATNTLTRGTWLDGNTGAHIDLAAGTKQVVLVQDASQIVSATGFTMSGSINWAPAVTLAAASTVALGAAASNIVIISGATTINAFDTIADGAMRKVKHTGGHILTYNAASMILRGAASITTEANAFSIFRSLGAGNWEQLVYQLASELPPTAASVKQAAINYSLAG